MNDSRKNWRRWARISSACIDVRPLLAGLLALQLLLGIGSVLSDLPPLLVLAHNGIASMLLLCVLRLRLGATT